MTKEYKYPNYKRNREKSRNRTESCAKQLGQGLVSSSNKLKKSLLFKYIALAGDDICYRCNSKIITIEELSVEHKTPWLHATNAEELFFDLANVAFSHLSCNTKAARRYSVPCGTASKYNNGHCKCDECKKAFKAYRRKRYAEAKTKKVNSIN